MQLTRAADYALRMMVHLAKLPPGTRINRGALAGAGGIPEPFVGKILQTLAKAGLITSHRGVNGGFSLALPPEGVTMLDVIEAAEGPTILNVCVNEGQGCRRKPWCPAHPVWLQAHEALTGVLRGATLASLASEVPDAEERLHLSR